jgi:hypothetical protein
MSQSRHSFVQSVILCKFLITCIFIIEDFKIGIFIFILFSGLIVIYSVLKLFLLYNCSYTYVR